MLALSVNTYIHLIFIVVIFCCLVAELMLVKEQVSYDIVKKLSKIDALYGVAAIIVVTTGLLNWMNFGKGYDYYAFNTLFNIKFSLFIVVGLLSLYPTILFARTKKKYKAERPENVSLPSQKNIRKVIIIELIIMSSIPLLAELMANGIDI